MIILIARLDYKSAFNMYILFFFKNFLEPIYNYIHALKLVLYQKIKFLYFTIGIFLVEQNH